MSLENLVIVKTHDLPIRHVGNVHNGKVRSVYWLNAKDSKKVRELFGTIAPNPLGVMIISDRISAFECIWQSKGMAGVPKKGASLNAISQYWFKRFEEEGLAGNHILATPHPLAWIVQRAKPIMIEAIAREYIDGSMWREYEKGAREFCDIELPDGLKRGQKLDKLMLTPTTKGTLRNIPGIPEKDDVNITRQQIVGNYRAFGFNSVKDVSHLEMLLAKGFYLISGELDDAGELFGDTKFEFGYILNLNGKWVMVYIDEVGTPDSSREYDKKQHAKGILKENSKEPFRNVLLNGVPDRDVLLNKKRMPERIELAKNYRVSDEDMMEVSRLYEGLAEKITKKPLPKIGNAREEIIDSLAQYGIIE